MSGPLVFRLELPFELAPTLNEYSSKKRIKGRNGYRFVMAKLNKEVDGAIVVAMAAWPEARMRDLRRRVEPKRDRNGRALFTPKGKPRTTTVVTGGRRRLVRVTRFSSVRPDEVAVDVIGGKVPLDRMVHQNILRDDSVKWCERESAWERARRGEGRLLVEVYELEEQGR